MKAIRQHRYGSPDTLALCEVEPPTPRQGEVLVRVEAAGLHRGDCFVMRGAPFVVRFMTGLLRPKRGVPGFDVAGQIEAVGEGVRGFAPGDEVFGSAEGTCAEYACAKAREIAPKPANLNFEEAASIPTSALAALHALRDAAAVQSGQRALIIGASGGVRTFAVQLAKSYGAEVTGVCSTANVDMVRSIGADHVVDYTREDFVDGGPRFDVIFDNVENRPLRDCRRALTPAGTLILNSGSEGSGLAFFVRLIKPIILNPFVRQKLKRYLSEPKQEDLLVLKQLAESGVLKPVIDRTVPLRKTPEALGYLEQGHARGKVVVTVA